MPRRTVLSNEYFDLFYHEEDKIIHHVFKEKLDSENFPKVLLAGTEVLKTNGAIKWLSDNRRHTIELTDEDNAWANNVWFPQTMRAGWKYWAIVVPDSIVNRADLVRYVNSFHGKGIKVQVFTDDQKALDWLKRVDQV
ncbi:MAG TPA: hypothetical protein VHL11_12655 [Phototrophicaceae bacterium]|jgi:hypothetical protein|nr:hypothetical protein [Phototrophicaceae bacterium]